MLHFTYIKKPLKMLILRLTAVLLSTFSVIAWADSNNDDTVAISSEPEESTVTDLDPFPSPESKYQRHVVRLPVGNYENNLKIELLPGKVEEVDCNPTHYTGQLTEKTLEGWGYNYYELSDLTGPLSTKMACPDEEKSLQFIPVLSTGSLLEYNSSLPVVVYLPEGLELRWRTWVATPYNTATIK